MHEEHYAPPGDTNSIPTTHFDTLNEEERRKAVVAWLDGLTSEFNRMSTNEQNWGFQDATLAPPMTLFELVLLSEELLTDQHGAVQESVKRIRSLMPFSDSQFHALAESMKGYYNPHVPGDFGLWYEQDRLTADDALALERWREWLGHYFDETGWDFRSANGPDLTDNRGIEILRNLGLPPKPWRLLDWSCSMTSPGTPGPPKAFESLRSDPGGRFHAASASLAARAACSTRIAS